jgi:hypothetical protein
MEYNNSKNENTKIIKEDMKNIIKNVLKNI